PGATGVHLAFLAGSGVVLRAEVPAVAGETIAVQVALDAAGALQVWTASQNALYLPVDERYQPALPILPAANAAGLDLALVVDGTARHGSAEERTAHAAKLVALARELATRWPECRAALIAFADQPAPHLAAKDLIPLYHLFPADGEMALQAFDAAQLEADLRAVPATFGGDFVDALADALAAAARLRWRPDARKVLVVSGDSPGHSVLHPLRRGADIGVRARDIDTEASRLHRSGVETVTIYLQPPAEKGLYDVEFKRHLLLAAQAQYARLASLPEYAFRAPAFDPAAAAGVVAGNRLPIGRGASLAELVDAVPARTHRPAAAAQASRPDEDAVLPVE
ncbi:MAG TPA: hypothetical protein VFS60_15700, partial [Thermoanaerobaculia bacterium]|nr:hypothetical protein [Thermoanaerobaculia bacterium]